MLENKKPTELHNLIEGTRNITERLVPLYRTLRSSAYKLIGEEDFEKGRPAIKRDTKTINSLNAKQENLLNMVHETIEELNYTAEILCREVGADLDIWNYIEKPEWSKGESRKERDIFDKECSKVYHKSILGIMGDPQVNKLAKEDRPYTLIWQNNNKQIILEEYNVGVYFAKKMYEDMGKSIKWNTLEDIQVAKTWLDKEETFNCSKKENKISLKSTISIMGDPHSRKSHGSIEGLHETFIWITGSVRLELLSIAGVIITLTKFVGGTETPLPHETIDDIKNAKKWLDSVNGIYNDATKTSKAYRAYWPKENISNTPKSSNCVEPPKEKVKRVSATDIVNIMGTYDSYQKRNTGEGNHARIIWNNKKDNTQIKLTFSDDDILSFSKIFQNGSKSLPCVNTSDIKDAKNWLRGQETPSDSKLTKNYIINILGDDYRWRGDHPYNKGGKGSYLIWTNGRGNLLLKIYFQEDKTAFFYEGTTNEKGTSRTISSKLKTLNDLIAIKNWLYGDETKTSDNHKAVTEKDVMEILGYDVVLRRHHPYKNTGRGYYCQWGKEEDSALQIYFKNRKYTYCIETIIKGEVTTSSPVETIEDIKEAKKWLDEQVVQEVSPQAILDIMGKPDREEISRHFKGIFTRTYIWENEDLKIKLQFRDKQIRYFSKFWGNREAVISHETIENIKDAKKWLDTWLDEQVASVDLQDFIRILGKYDKVGSLITEKKNYVTYLWQEGDIKLKLHVCDGNITELIKVKKNMIHFLACKTIEDIKAARRWWDEQVDSVEKDVPEEAPEIKLASLEETIEDAVIVVSKWVKDFFKK